MNSVWAAFGLLGAILLSACGGGQPSKGDDRVAPALFPRIDGEAVLRHIKVLASDDYEGRFPGTKGETLTVAYLTEQFRKAGLKPGNTDGTSVQRVPLMGIKPDPTMTLTFGKGGRQQRLTFRDDFVAWTKRPAETVGLDKSGVVFVGYGVQAPEFNWDDYKGADLKGKTLIMLIGDPPVPDPADPAKLDPKVFGGKAMTYYGRWTYKFEVGARLGAAGVFVVHETEPAGYPFSTLQTKVGEQATFVGPDGNTSRPEVEGWIPLEQAKKVFALAGQDYDSLKKAALSRAFKPVAFDLEASIAVHNTLRPFDSRNVIGKVDGSDPALRNEYVFYTAHWDHYGIGAPVNGDTIYNGAVDDATGTAGLIELGRAFAALRVKPKRSIVFLAVTAEEGGTLGSQYYAANPVYPLAKTLAVINMDMMNVDGRTKDVTIIGLGNSDLDDYAAAAARDQGGRVLVPDPMPEKGFYYRSDHFSFAKQGVPALMPGPGVDAIGRPPGWGRERLQRYTANDYHKPSDEVKPDWDLSGFAEDLQCYWMIGYRVAEAAKYPEWKPGTEFKAAREAQLKGRR